MTGAAAILLAAGESARMGQQKALLDWGGQPLLVHQVRSLLDAGASQVVVVLGHQARRLRPLVPADPRVQVTVSRRYRQGKSFSIKSGLRRLAPDAAGVLIVGVDQPRHPDTLRALLRAFQDRSADIVAPSYKGARGHPVLFSARLLSELRRISEETRGLRGVVERHLAERVLVEVDDPLVLEDLNTPEEYQRARRLVSAPR